jgi:cell division protein FtsI (penicillin-binding protein 3)
MPDPSNTPSQPGEPTPAKPSAFSRLVGSLKRRWEKPTDAQLTFNFDAGEKPPIDAAPQLPTERFVMADDGDQAGNGRVVPPAPAGPTAETIDESAPDPLGERPTVGVTQWLSVWRDRWLLASAASKARAEAIETARAQAAAEAAAAEAKSSAVAAQPPQAEPAASKWRAALAFLRRKPATEQPQANAPACGLASSPPIESAEAPSPTAEVLADIPAEMPAEKPIRFAGLRALLARVFTRHTPITAQPETETPPAACGLADESTQLNPQPDPEATKPSPLAAARAALAAFFTRRAKAEAEPIEPGEPLEPAAPIEPPAPPVPPRPLTPAQIADRRINWVARAAMIALTTAFVGLVGRVVQLQAHPPAQIARLEGSQTSTVKIQDTRGKIEDRDGRILVGTVAVKQLFVDPKLVTDFATFSARISSALGMNGVDIEKKISARADKRYVVINRELSDDQIDKLKSFKLPGLGTDTRMVRRYPQGQLAAHILGVADSAGKGIEGIEKIQNARLTGTPGHIEYLRDAQRRPLWIEDAGYKLPQDGESIRLSIDSVVQSIVEKELADACQQYDAESGSVVMLNPYTGEVLAMANYPSIEPASFGTSPADRRRNRAVTDTFEPGSTFKPFVWSFATELGFAKPHEMIDCTTSGSWVSANGRHLHDAHPVGLVDWETVLVKSSNIGMATVGQRMGSEPIFNAITSFGFGQRTQSGLPGEVRGKVRPFARWTTFSVTSVPMGQEVSVTAIQMARAFSVFANGGYLPKPTYLALDPMDAAIAAADQRVVLKPETVSETRQVLRRVVTEGTGKKADSPLYDIFGKTGTAQIAGGKGGYIPDAYIGSFVCSAPLENPQVVVECVIRRPNKSKGYYGGTVAAPAARRIIEQTLNYMGVAPNAAKEEENDKPIVAANASLKHHADD